MRMDFLLNPTRKVIVLIWTSVGNPHSGNQEVPFENIGHASILINTGVYKSYTSIVPTTDPNQDVFKTRTFANYDAEWQETIAQDVQAEASPPQFVFCFYGLEVEKMKNRINEIKEQRSSWSLLGTGNSFSCASLAWKILLAGDIGRFIGTWDLVTGSSGDSGAGTSRAVTASRKSDGQAVLKTLTYLAETIAAPFFGVQSPDNLVTKLKIAKARELEIYRLTRDYERYCLEGYENVIEWRPENKCSKLWQWIRPLVFIFVGICVVYYILYLSDFPLLFRLH